MIDIIGTELYQWDVGRSVKVTDFEATHVHFANQGDAKAVKIELADSQALIPDYLLQTGKQLCVYAVANGVTIERKMFSVKKRERPEDYVYDEDQRNFIYELIQSTEDAVLAAKQAIQDLIAAKERGDFNGPKGEKGEKGDPGEDGKPGADGKDGQNGKDGSPGADGYTPQKGVDYWTDGDKTEVVNAVLEALPNGDEVAY